MTKRTNHQKPSEATQEAAMKLARAYQRPAQTKEQTQLVAQGIQKGIEQYKKQQKAKARELDKALKKYRSAKPRPDSGAEEANENTPETLIVQQQAPLPWILLILSWIGFIAFYFVKSK